MQLVEISPTKTLSESAIFTYSLLHCTSVNRHLLNLYKYVSVINKIALHCNYLESSS